MNIRNYKEPKPKRDYKRNYNGDGSIKNIDVSLLEIKQLVSEEQVLSTIQWLAKVNPNYARFDITVSATATKIAKQILIEEEWKLINNTPNKKENSLLSSSTYKNINVYIFNLYQKFKELGWIEYTFVSRKVTYTKNNEEISFSKLEASAYMTDKGKEKLNQK